MGNIIRKVKNPEIKTGYKKKESKEVKADLYISPGGNDKNEGTYDKPFATFERAKQAVRSLKQSAGEVVVSVQEGTYSVAGLLFTNEDRGTAECPIRYYANGKVEISGGIKLNPEDFSPVSGEAAESLCNEAKNRVYQADLKKYGLKTEDWGKVYAVGNYNTANKYDGDHIGTSCELFYNNRRMTLARYPNGNDFNRIAAVMDVGDVRAFPDQNYFDEWQDSRNHRGGTYIIDKETAERVKTWKYHEDVWMFGYFFYDWADASTPVLEFDTGHRIVRPMFVSEYGCRKDAPYYFFNILEELDEPGEWYLDRKNGILYLYPLDDIETANIELSITANDLIRGENTDHLTFDGFIFKLTRGNAINITGNDNKIQNCTITNIFGHAVIMNGYRNKVVECEISHTGKGGIFLDGGDRYTLNPGCCAAHNNLIHDWAEIYLTYQPAVQLSGVGNICSHNEIYNSPHMAIGYYGNDHSIEYNLIHDVVKQSSDAGVIYSGMSWTAHGTVIRYNCIFNIGEGEHNPDGIYWDDALSGQTAYGNLLVNIRKSAFGIGGGRDNRVINNIIINSGCALYYDERARNGFIDKGWFKNCVVEKTSSLWKTLYGVPYKSSIWQEKYPSLAKVTDDFNDYENPDFPTNPSNNIITGNLIIDSKKLLGNIVDSAYRFGSVENNMVYGLDEDVGFTDPENGDYSLKPDSGVFKDIPGFEKITLDKIGRI